MATKRQFVPRSKDASKRLEKIRDRMMFGYGCIVNQIATENGWIIKTTQWPLSEHHKEYLRKKNFPVPGKNKCKLSVCDPENQKIKAPTLYGR